MMFEFGWLFWVLFFVIFFGCGRMCGWGARRYLDRGRRFEEGGSDEETRPIAGSRSTAALGRDSAQPGILGDASLRGDREEGRDRAVLRGRTGSPLQRLQKKFVEGRITLEEYERELDRLDRLD